MMLSRIAAGGAGVLTALLLQASLIGPWTFPVAVSLPAVLVVLVGIHAGPGAGLGLGFVTGLLADLGSEHPAGVQALCWLGAGLLGGVLGGLAVERGYADRGVAALAASIASLAAAASTALFTVLGPQPLAIATSAADLVPAALGDALLALVLAPLVRRMVPALGVRPPRPAAAVLGRLHVPR
jgi:cell shape-determining protein MreD